MMNHKENILKRRSAISEALPSIVVGCCLLLGATALSANAGAETKSNLPSKTKTAKNNKGPWGICLEKGLRRDECDEPFEDEECQLAFCLPHDDDPDDHPDDEEDPDEDPDDDEEPDEDPDGEEEPDEDPDGEEEPDEDPDGEEEPDEDPDGEEEPDEDPDGDEEPQEPTPTGDAIGNCPNGNPAPDNRIHQVSRDKALAASKFLSQATMGANYATITQVAKLGHEAWLQQQFQLPVSKHQPYTTCMHQIFDSYENGETAGDIFGDPVFFKRFAWWTQSLSAPDMLRQRVAMALSEIFVVSDKVGILFEDQYSLTGYYDMLLENSFGNFRKLLFDVTMHPSMGTYLSHANNSKSNPQTGTFPDENYAREVMQLFSIGLYELNLDGTRKKDAQGNDIPTYDNSTIREFAKVFTGLTYSGEESEFGVNDEGEAAYYFAEPMVMYEQYHDTTSKKLLNGKVLPANQSGMKDIDDAIDNLFNHPNVGPFISNLLIKRLVTSNPSPAYVARVAKTFNGSENTPRGDMRSVLKAILLDPEANQANRLREPFLRVVQLYRSFSATTVDGTYNLWGDEVYEHTLQHALSSPSVFNFFQPDYAPNGEIKDQGLTAPEFQIVNSATIISIKNLLYFATLDNGGRTDLDNYAPIDLDLSQEIELAKDPAKLVDHLDLLLTYGTLTANTRNAIINALKRLPEQNERAILAVYLMMLSPDYAAAI